MYQELGPERLPVDLGAAAGQFVLWTRSSAPDDRAGPHRILPDGCLDLIWSGDELFVAGPDTRAHLTPTGDRAAYVGIRFPAGRGPDVLGVPAVELRDTRVPLAALWPAPATRALTEKLTEALTKATPATDRLAGPAAVLARAVAGRLARPDPVTGAVWSALRAGARVDATADAIGLTARQLHRRCLRAFGYGPKTLARVLRFDRAIALARTGTPLAAVAVDTGYADQAHLAREVRHFAGLPLRALLAEEPLPPS